MDGVLLGRRSAEAAARFFSQSERVHGALTEGRRPQSQPIPNIVQVKNTLGRGLARCSAVLIGNPTPSGLGTEAADLYTLVNPSLRGQRAAYSGDEPIVGILLGDLSSGETGVAQIAGVVPAAFRYDETGGTVASAWADISDTDDKLTFSNFGPIRVLQRDATVNLASASKVWMVDLGSPTSLGSTDWLSSEITWANTFEYGNIWSTKIGDAIRVGLHQVGTTTALRLGRVGRYWVVVEWSLLFAITTGDRISWRIAWSDSQQQIQGEFNTDHFPAPFGPFVGERSFSIINTGDAPVSPIPLPSFRIVRVPTGGGSSALITNANGRIRVRVVKLGAGPFNTVWPEANRDAAWARSATAWPLSGGGGFPPPE
jgi:hypothetical protein